MTIFYSICLAVTFAPSILNNRIRIRFEFDLCLIKIETCYCCLIKFEMSGHLTDDRNIIFDLALGHEDDLIEIC